MRMTEWERYSQLLSNRSSSVPRVSVPVCLEGLFLSFSIQPPSLSSVPHWLQSQQNLKEEKIWLTTNYSNKSSLTAWHGTEAISWLTVCLPAEIKLPLLAMISWSLLSMLDSLLIRGAQISVRSMAMSPVLLVVVIFNCREEKRQLGGENRDEEG